MRICPNCRGNRFLAKAQVVQEWLIDECDLCIEVTDDCVAIVHDPGDNDIWVCRKCGFTSVGADFYVDEIQIE